MKTSLSVNLRYWSEVDDCPIDVAVDCLYTPGHPGVCYYADGSGDPPEGPEVEIVDVRPKVNVDAYRDEILRLCDEEMADRQLYFVDLQEDAIYE